MNPGSADAIHLHMLNVNLCGICYIYLYMYAEWHLLIVNQFYFSFSLKNVSIFPEDD
jgi:hypothetical protein